MWAEVNKNKAHKTPLNIWSLSSYSLSLQETHCFVFRFDNDLRFAHHRLYHIKHYVGLIWAARRMKSAALYRLGMHLSPQREKTEAGVVRVYSNKPNQPGEEAAAEPCRHTVTRSEREADGGKDNKLEARC